MGLREWHPERRWRLRSATLASTFNTRKLYSVLTLIKFIIGLHDLYQ